MKQLLYAIFLFSALAARANPGDTTIVQANKVRLDYYNKFDTAVAFPTGNTTYRKIYMVFTLGKYPCATGTQYCGDWDYTVLNYLMTPGGDTLEVARLITPYANAGGPRTPFGWKQNYIFDVTDYAGKLKGSATQRILYSGYSGGFTADVKYIFIEGTPERTVTGISPLWSGSYSYGGTDPIANHFQDTIVHVPAGTASSEMRMLVTGHGSDDNGCCEFMSHHYRTYSNGVMDADHAIWRDKCGQNNLFPQTGTWIYDRANWCPGELIEEKRDVLTGIIADSFVAGLQFDSYTSPGGNVGSYTTDASVFHYGPMNKALDASLEEVLAPSKYEGHFRLNPSCGQPSIRVRNSGLAPITSLRIEYGVKDSVMSVYNWNNDTIASRTDKTITLPQLPTITQLSQARASGLYGFVARITAVNGTADADSTNNKLTDSFAVAPIWPDSFVVNFKTNSSGTYGLNAGSSETTWELFDLSDRLIASRKDVALNTVFTDTIRKLEGGCYKLVVKDGGCDGLYWWAYASYPASQRPTEGYLRINRIGSPAGTIPLNFTSYTGTYRQDFGCGYTQYFTVASKVTNSVQELSAGNFGMQLFPNPASTTVQLNVEGASGNGTAELRDITGRMILTRAVRDGHVTLPVGDVANGVYQVTYRHANGAHLTQQLIIAR